MKKRISGIGLIFLLAVKYPPLPEFSLFRKENITLVRSLSLRKAALGFLLN